MRTLWNVCLYSINICCNIFIFIFIVSLELQNYQSMLHLHHSHTKLSNEVQLTVTHQDLLHKPHPLFQVNYFLKKYC